MQLLVVIEDCDSDHPVKHHELPKAGDVLHYGEHWGTGDLSHDFWRIIDVPGLTEAEAKALIAPEQLPRNAHEFIHRSRGMRLDLAKLGIDLKTRHESGIEPPISVDVLRSAMMLKERVPHPDVVGPVDSHMIG